MKKILAISFTLLVGLGAANLLAESAKTIGERYRSVEPPHYGPYEQEEKSPEFPNPEPSCLGPYIITAYCPCEVCCGKWSDTANPLTAGGTTPIEGLTIGADWDKLAPGTTICIDGIGKRVVEDKVVGWVAEKYDGKVIDLYFTDHQKALNFGKQTLNIWVIE